MALGLGQQLRIVRRVGRLRAGRDVADRLIAGREHRQDQLSGPGCTTACPRHTAPGCPRRASRPRPGWPRRARCRRCSRACRARRAPSRVRVVADVVVQEVEDLLRVVVELGGLFLDERVGGVGVGRRGEQARVGTFPGCSVAAGVEFETAPASSVAKPARRMSSCSRGSAGRQVDRQGHARPVVSLDRAQAPGQVLAALVGLRGWRRQAYDALTNVTPGSRVVVSSTPVSGSACSL